MDQPTTRTPSLRPHEYLVSLNGVQVRVYCPADGRIEVDDREVDAHVSLSPNGNGTVELEGRQYRLVLEPSAMDGREFSVLMTGRRASGTVDDQRSMLRQRMKQEESLATAQLTVKAPMPGLVIRILVKTGQEIAKGEGLLVLEAMKMENEVRSDRAGVIDTILVTERSPVEKGQPLITVKPNV